MPLYFNQFAVDAIILYHKREFYLLAFQVSTFASLYPYMIPLDKHYKRFKMQSSDNFFPEGNDNDDTLKEESEKELPDSSECMFAFGGMLVLSSMFVCNGMWRCIILTTNEYCCSIPSMNA